MVRYHIFLNTMYQPIIIDIQKYIPCTNQLYLVLIKLVPSFFGWYMLVRFRTNWKFEVTNLIMLTSLPSRFRCTKTIGFQITYWYCCTTFHRIYKHSNIFYIIQSFFNNLLQWTLKATTDGVDVDKLIRLLRLEELIQSSSIYS